MSSLALAAPSTTLDLAAIETAIMEGPDWLTYHRLAVAGELHTPRETASEADFRLACIYAAHTRDPDAVTALMQGSALVRPKWQERRGAGTYLDLTVRHALAHVRVPLMLELPTATSEQARSLADLWADPDARKPPVVLLPRFAWRGRLSLVAAPDKGGKSTLVAAAVAAMSRGAPFLGSPTVPGRTLWALLEEHANDCASRAVRFNTDPAKLHVLERPRDPAATLRAEVARLRPDLVVVDTLVRYAADRVTEAGSAAQWSPVMTELEGLAREFGCGVVALHHSRKSDGQARDSGEITARCDCVLEQPTRPQDGVQRFTVRARWNVGDFAVRLEGDTYALVTSGDGDGLTETERTVLEALSDEGATATQWEHAAGKPRTTFKRARRKLVDSALVELQGETYRRRPAF